MSGQVLRVPASHACAFCGEPLVFTGQGIKAWRVGNEIVCNEFCADGVATSDKDALRTTSALDLSSG